jgi:hypothetical protein
MGSHVERGYTGPPMPANQRSSGRDRNPAIPFKYLRNKGQIWGIMRKIGGLNCPEGRLGGYPMEGC